MNKRQRRKYISSLICIHFDVVDLKRICKAQKDKDIDSGETRCDQCPGYRIHTERDRRKYKKGVRRWLSEWNFYFNRDLPIPTNVRYKYK